MEDIGAYNKPLYYVCKSIKKIKEMDKDCDRSLNFCATFEDTRVGKEGRIIEIRYYFGIVKMPPTQFSKSEEIK